MLIRRSGTQVIGERQETSLPGEIDLALAPDFHLGSLHAQPSTLQVNFAGESRTLEPRVMQVLTLLANQRGSVVSRDRLIERCWGGRVVSEDAINRCIAKVRRVGSETEAFEVETIPRVGYRLNQAGAALSPPTSRSRQGRRVLAAIAAVLVLALAGAGLWYLRSTSEPPQPVVAVLPFTLPNSDPEAAKLADDVVTTIRSALVQTGARLPDAVIRSVDAARRSGALMIVSGTLIREGSKLRITAQVDSARSKSSLLTQDFEGTAAEAPGLSAGVAGWLIPSVRMWSSFLPAERDPAVTDEIMRMFLTRSSGDHTRAWNLSRTLAYAKPKSGSAQYVYALLTYEQLGALPVEERAATLASARQAAINAASELPKSGRALVLLDCYLTAPSFPLLTPKCDRTTRAAISEDPNIPVLPWLFGYQLTNSGRFTEAAQFIDMDLAQNPLGGSQLDSRVFAGRMSGLSEGSGSLEQFEERARRYLGPYFTDSMNFRIAMADGDVTTAERLIDNPLDGRDLAFGDARATAKLVFRAVKSKSPGDVATARRICNPAAPDVVPAPPAFEICLGGLATLNDLDSVFALAGRHFPEVVCCSRDRQTRQWLVQGGGYPSRWILFGKAMAPARADRRFIELARRTGLLAYWKSGHPPDFCMTEKVPVCTLVGSK